MAVTEGDIWKGVLDSYGDQYKELSDTWKLVESKAQSATAIAGLFLAATFAWTRELPAGFDPIDRLLLCVAMFCLSLSVGCAIISMRIRTAALPPFGRMTREAAQDLTRAFDETRVPDLYRTLVDQWEDANQRLIKQVNDKAESVYAAQVMLGWAALLSFVLAARVITGN